MKVPPHLSSKPGTRLLFEKVARLRELLIAAKDVGELCDYFEETLVTDIEFRRAGTRVEHSQLTHVLEAVLRAVAPGGKLARPLVLRVAEHHLCHGYSVWKNGLALFFYFEDLDVGFCAYAPEEPSAATCLTRFSVTQCCSTAEDIPERKPPVQRAD